MGFVFIQAKNSKGDDVFLLEMWTNEGLQKVFNLTDLVTVQSWF
jgi:hypothetical protein